MSNASLLSAATKRASQAEIERLQTAALSLTRCYADLCPTSTKEEEEDEKEEQQQQQHVDSLTLTKFCTLASSSPRFIFLLTPSNKLIRSADRGRTWKSIDVISDMTSSSSSGSEEDAKSNPVSKIRLLCMGCCSQTGAIAVAGTHGFVAISPPGQQQQQSAFIPIPVPSAENQQQRIILRRVFFNRSVTTTSAPASWKILIQNTEFVSRTSGGAPPPIFSEVTLLREDSRCSTVEIALFASNSSMMLAHISTAATIPTVSRRLLIPLKLGSVLRCKEVPLFAQSSPVGDSGAVGDACAPIATPSGFHRRFKWCAAQFRPGLATSSNSTAPALGKTAAASAPKRSSGVKYDHTVGSSIPRANIPSATEFFRSSLEAATAKSSSTAMSAAAELLDNLDDDDVFLSSFRGGLLPPDTVPRVFKCYATDGPVVKSDTTCWLWLWVGEDVSAAQQQQDENNSDDDDSEALTAAVYSTATNVSYLPLVQSSAATDTVGLTVTNGGRCIVRASGAGVSSSVDAGRTWTEPQLSCLVGAATLDGTATIVVSSRAAVALRETGSQSQKKPQLRPPGATRQGAASAVAPNQQQQQWGLFPLPQNLGVSIITDVAVMC